MGKIGIELLFSIASHLQTDDQIEVVSRTSGTLLKTILKEIFKSRETCLSHVQFSYNRTIHNTKYF